MAEIFFWVSGEYGAGRTHPDDRHVRLDEADLDFGRVDAARVVPAFAGAVAFDRYLVRAAVGLLADAVDRLVLLV